MEKAAQIKRQLGGSGAYADPVPERPKGMHQRTYERLCNEGEAEVAVGAFGQLEGFLSWHQGRTLVWASLTLN